MSKIPIKEAYAQIAKLPVAELLGMVYAYSGVPAFPRIKRAMSTVIIKGSGEEILARLREQEVIVFSDNGQPVSKRLESLDGQVRAEKRFRRGELQFLVDVDIIDPRRVLFFFQARTVHYSYMISGSYVT